MTIIPITEFYDIVHEFTETHYEDIFVIFGAFYTEREAQTAKSKDLHIVVLEWEWEKQNFVWSTDWNEGQKYILFEGIYTEDMLIDKFIPFGLECPSEYIERT